MPELSKLRAALALQDDGGLAPGLGGTGFYLFPPALLRGPPRHIAVRLPEIEPAALPAEAARFLAEGKPPWLIAFGSVFGRTRPMLIAKLSGLLRSRGQRVIIAWGAGGAPRVRERDGVLHLQSIDIAPVYPHVRAVVHHAGINTSVETIRARRPSIAFPYVGDQLDNATRLEELGVCISVAPQRQDCASTLREAIDRIVSGDLTRAPFEAFLRRSDRDCVEPREGLRALERL